MTMWEKIKSAGTLICGAFGLLASLATIFGYVGIGPAEAADGLGRIFFLSAPLMTFCCGAVSGWGFTRRWADRELSEREAENHQVLAEHERQLSAKDEEVARIKAETERQLAMKDDELRDRMERAEADFARRLAEREAEATRPVPERSEDEIASERYRRIVAGFSRAKAEAALRAFGSDGMIRARERELPEIIGSIQARQGVFTMQVLKHRGATIQTDTYGITDGFRAWLASDDGNRALLARPS